MSSDRNGDTPPVLVERSESVLTLRLNRPDRLNAVSETMYRHLIDHLASVKELGVRAVVLAGAGRSFCVGADLKDHRQDREDAERREYVLLGQRACLAVQRCHVPVVAAVHGHALGAGAELALSADFVIMAEDAKMGFPELSLGTFFGGGLTVRIVQLVGLARAKELLFVGEQFTGQDAARWGLIYRAVSAASLNKAVTELASQITRLAPVPTALAKDLIGRAQYLALDEVVRLEAEGLLACMATEDWAEGVRAFSEERPPRFEGR